MNTIINFLKKFFKSSFSKSKRIVRLPNRGEEFDNWLGV